MNKKKPTENQEINPIQKDDALFDALGKSKKQKKKRIIRTVIIIVLVLAIVLVTGTFILQKRVREKFNTNRTGVLSHTVATGSISTVVTGSGTIQNVDTETVAIPAGVELTEILIDYGDVVAAGEVIAIVDMGTVHSAISELQTAIEDLDKQLAAAEDDKVSAYIKAGVSGRVKVLFADTGSNVADIMVEHGALAVLSLDGYMAADLKTDSLSAGDAVTVIRPDGSEISGTVEFAAGGKATILVTDNGPMYDEEVTVMTQDGTTVGTAKLYVHNPLAVTGYAGTVSRVNVRENQKVYSSTAIFTLTDRETSANYDNLLRQRREKEDQLLELLKIQRYGGIVAPISGSICSVSSLDDEELTEVATISPDVSMSVTITVNENDILALAVGQEADITVRSVSEDVFPGKVTEIDKSGASEAYTAVIMMDKVSGMLPGMTASVDVKIEGVSNALIIPVDALHQTSTGAYVYTTYDPETQEYGGRKDVVAGLSNSKFVEIKSGLSEGDTVYYTKKQTFNIFGQFGGSPGQSSSGRGQMPGSGNNSSGRNSNRPNSSGARPSRG